MQELISALIPATPSSAGTVIVEAWTVETNITPWAFLSIEQMREAAHFVGREAGGFPDNVAWAVEDLAKSIIARAEEIERNVE